MNLAFRLRRPRFRGGVVYNPRQARVHHAAHISPPRCRKRRLNYATPRASIPVAHISPLQERRQKRFGNLAREAMLHATDDQAVEIHCLIREVKLGELSLAAAHVGLKAIRCRQRELKEAA